MNHDGNKGLVSPVKVSYNQNDDTIEGDSDSGSNCGTESEDEEVSQWCKKRAWLKACHEWQTGRKGKECCLIDVSLKYI